MKIFLLFFILPFLVACGTVAEKQVTSSEVSYKRDIALKINGKSFLGVAVVSKAPRYEIEGKTKASTELLRISNCHREYSKEKVGRRFKYSFTPNDFELQGPCPIEIAALDLKGQHSTAFIDFLRAETLEAIVDCNGSSASSSGVSLCHARTGLTQRVRFKTKVRVKTSDSSICVLPTSKDGLNWSYKVGKKQCLYVFYVNATTVHRHTTLPYQEILIRNL